MGRHTSGMVRFWPSPFGSSGVKNSACLRSLRARGSDAGVVDATAFSCLIFDAGATSVAGSPSAILLTLCVQTETATEGGCLKLQKSQRVEVLPALAKSVHLIRSITKPNSIAANAFLKESIWLIVWKQGRLKAAREVSSHMLS